MTDASEWISRAKPVDAAAVEVGFLISDSFHYGPENGFSPERWQAQREPLYQPEVARHGRYALTSALAESRDELLKYYADVIRLRDKYKKRWARQPPYFWMRPLIFSLEVFEISFPWYDTWEETKPLLAFLDSSGEGETFSDLEQGWEVGIFTASGRLFMREGDFDSGEEHECVSCDRADLAAPSSSVA